MMMKAEHYARSLARNGSLPVEAQWDLIKQLELIETEIGYSREYITTASPAPSLGKTAPHLTVNIRDFSDRIEIIQGEYSQTHVLDGGPPDDYIQESIVHKMVPHIASLTKFSKTDTFNGPIGRMTSMRGTLYIFRSKS